MAENGALTRKELEECLAVVATKDDLERLTEKFATKDDLKRFATKVDFDRMAARVAILVGDMEELKERIPPKDHFSKMMVLMDGMAKAFEDQNQRLWGHADLWEKLHDKVHKDHEPRIASLESNA